MVSRQRVLPYISYNWSYTSGAMYFLWVISLILYFLVMKTSLKSYIHRKYDQCSVLYGKITGFISNTYTLFL